MGHPPGGTLDVFRNLFGTLSGGLSIFSNNPFQRKPHGEEHVDSIAKQFEASALVDRPVKVKTLDADAKLERDHGSRSKRERGFDLPSEIVSKNYERKKRRQKKSEDKFADGEDMEHTGVLTTKEACTFQNVTIDETEAGHQREENSTETGVMGSNNHYSHVKAKITRPGKKKGERNGISETDLNESETPIKKNIAAPKPAGDAPHVSKGWSADEIEKDTEEMNIRGEYRVNHDAEGYISKKSKKKGKNQLADDHTEEEIVEKDSITCAKDVPCYKRKSIEVETQEMNGNVKDGSFLGRKTKDRILAEEESGTGTRKKSKNIQGLKSERKVETNMMDHPESGRKLRKALSNLQVDDKQNVDLPVPKKRKLGIRNLGLKRQREDDIEERYEKRLKSQDEATVNQELSHGRPEKNKARKYDSEGEDTHNAPSKKRKLTESRDEQNAAMNRAFDDQEKLRRTVFIGNLPLQLRKKDIIKEFSQYGSVESVRLRSVPLLDTKMPRKGAIIKGQVNEAIGSKHAYVVFKEEGSAKASLAHNMQELLGNHIRVDAAHAPGKVSKDGHSMAYDRAKSIFIGNLPFDVKDEELYQLFGMGPNPEVGVEAIRVVRDPQTSLSKGIAFVLFKSKAGASQALSKRIVKLRNRILRISRVLPTQSEQRSTTKSGKRQREQEGREGGLSKRAKRLQPYEGTRATKVDGRPGKWTASSSNKDRFKATTNGVQPGRTKSPAASIKKGYQAESKQNYAGVKRKRTEKRQRGISRAKKIRRA